MTAGPGNNVPSPPDRDPQAPGGGGAPGRVPSPQNRRPGRLRTALTDLRYRLAPWTPPAGSVHWFFIATFPNGGSTALADLLASAGAGVKLSPSGEGQWLVPELTAGRHRWDPCAPVDWSRVRRIWLHAVRRQARRPCVVIEKSPPMMVRMREALHAFSDMPCRLLRFSRDPFAVCSSWASRYNPQLLARAWDEPTSHLTAGSPAFFRALGDIYGRRAVVMHQLAEIADASLSYEDLTAAPAAALAKISSMEPLLADANPETRVVVKDYAPQTLRNMNQRQIDALSVAQIAAISEGLRPYADAVEALGYRISL